MNRLFIILIFGIIISGTLSVSTADQISDSTKFHFTQTISSSQDLGQGYEEYQMALVLSPNTTTIYDGSMTFISNSPVTPIVFHEIASDEIIDQSVWTVDGKSFFVISELGAPKTSASFEFTGAALGLRAESEFSATLSTSGSIHGQPVDLVIPRLDDKEISLHLSRTNIPVTIPMHKGLYNGSNMSFIITDSSDAEYAKIISEIKDWQVQHAPPLRDAPNSTLQKLFVFKNGIKGSGLFGYQPNILSSIPSASNYSALVSVIEVSWKTGQRPMKLDTISSIMTTADSNRIKLNDTGIVLNAPQITWPGGQMMVRSNDTITDETAYSGQIVEINHVAMNVTFVAHRGWGPDGRTVYCIVTDATPKGPAETMGTIVSPTSVNLIASPVAADLFQFKNGIIGSGPLGFQPSIASAAPGDEDYTPMWRVYLVEWKDPKTAKVLETTTDIDHFRSSEMLSVSIARPTNLSYILNCPIIDPFQ